MYAARLVTPGVLLPYELQKPVSDATDTEKYEVIKEIGDNDDDDDYCSSGVKGSVLGAALIGRFCYLLAHKNEANEA